MRSRRLTDIVARFKENVRVVTEALFDSGSRPTHASIMAPQDRASLWTRSQCSYTSNTVENHIVEANSLRSRSYCDCGRRCQGSTLVSRARLSSALNLMHWQYLRISVIQLDALMPCQLAQSSQTLRREINLNPASKQPISWIRDCSQYCILW